MSGFVFFLMQLQLQSAVIIIAGHCRCLCAVPPVFNPMNRSVFENATVNTVVGLPIIVGANTASITMVYQISGGNGTTSSGQQLFYIGACDGQVRVVRVGL